MPGAQEVAGVPGGECAVAGAHQRLGGRRWRACVEPPAARLVVVAEAAGARESVHAGILPGAQRTGVTYAGKLEKVTLTHKEIFERYLYAGAISRDPGAVAAMFTEDGVYEAPLVPDGHRLPRRLAGRDAIRAGMGAFHRELPSGGTVNAGHSRLVLHETADADVFIAELDAVLDHPGGRREPVSLVQVFRVRDGRIAMLRDYFTL